MFCNLIDCFILLIDKASLSFCLSPHDFSPNLLATNEVVASSLYHLVAFSLSFSPVNFFGSTIVAFLFKWHYSNDFHNHPFFPRFQYMYYL